MIGASQRIPIMTLLKLIVTLLATGLLVFLALPSLAANGDDGVTNGSPSTGPSGPAAKPQHRKQRKHRQQQQPGRGSPTGAPAPQGTNFGGSEIG
jgi:hypothetical protein